MLFRKKRVELIEAFRYVGGFKDADGKCYVPNWAMKAFNDYGFSFIGGELVRYGCSEPVPVGCYIIRGTLHDSAYFMSAKEFEDMYEPVSEE